MTNKKRFQECNKIVQIWRYRWYLAIPFIFVYKYIKGIKIHEDEMVDDKLVHTDKYFEPSAKLLWKLIKGEVQGYMKWYYTEEVFANIKNKKRNKRIKHD